MPYVIVCVECRKRLSCYEEGLEIIVEKCGCDERNRG